MGFIFQGSHNRKGENMGAGNTILKFYRRGSSLRGMLKIKQGGLNRRRIF